MENDVADALIFNEVCKIVKKKNLVVSITDGHRYREVTH